MRPISFAGLHRILRLLADQRGPVCPGRLDDLVRSEKACPTGTGTPPSRTWLYHCRNTLIRLGAVRRVGRSLQVEDGNDAVERLLAEPPAQGPRLSEAAQDAFAALALADADCRRWFFHLFMAQQSAYGVCDFRGQAQPVVWTARSDRRAKSVEAVLSRQTPNEGSIVLSTPSQVKGVLYGVRFWARDELGLLDEYHVDGMGTIMFAYLRPSAQVAVDDAVSDVLSLMGPEQEWTTLSLRDLVARCCVTGRRPIRTLFAAIEKIVREHYGRVVLVPTSRAFATITGTTREAEELRLRSYYQEASGRYISHIRLHQSLRGTAACQRT